MNDDDEGLIVPLNFIYFLAVVLLLGFIKLWEIIWWLIENL